MKIHAPLIAAFSLCALFVSPYSKALDAPIGVRPCCAFGQDLKTELLGMPIPFFSVENIVDIPMLGKHSYNDGSQSVISSLFGLGGESNGLIFTSKGGFIDTAHVRDTADFTYYLYQQIRQHLGSHYRIILPTELRARHIRLQENKQLLTNKEKQSLSLELAALLAFRLAQWHEIAQWFGYESIIGFPEYVSAFSPEDLYSNMLGAITAKQVLEQQPDLSPSDFSQAMTDAFNDQLQQLGSVSAEETKRNIQLLNGQWWDHNTRLPQKWVVLKRDYQLGLTLYPNGVKNGVPLSLSTELSNGDNNGMWAELYLHNVGNEETFNALAPELTNNMVWQPAQFQQLATFAKQQDYKERGKTTQVVKD
ncbi:DUF4056 domain-containing protein [Photobacterium sp. GB-72]|uniref:DUF4056 domain-containing protein n=1 Tax=Photobacterium sp. GB-72 TaxID=2022105 RepID=UPI000D15FC48|nr:DUF4056 domain-containing protein [Photobacterium sp. GB-72]PSV28031.1 DUF4056 domain-containing protein [Photobacterium sp. GB-72]